jgi:16S rRNA G1207 methylase RsmC
MKTVEAIIRGAPAAMTCKATFQMVVRSKIGRKTLPKVFEETFGNFTVLARESGYRVIMAEKQ